MVALMISALEQVMQRSGLKIILPAVVAAVLATLSAKAGLTGSVINVSPYYPDTNSLYDSAGDRTVSDAVEYPAFSFDKYSPPTSIDISDTQIIITNNSIYDGPYASAPFNGWVLTIISGPAILSAAPDPNSQVNPVDMWIVNGNQLWMNFEGETELGHSATIIDITTIPEPSTTVLLGLSLPILLALKSRFRAARN
jgi:hypothetical protein